MQIFFRCCDKKDVKKNSDEEEKAVDCWLGNRARYFMLFNVENVREFVGSLREYGKHFRLWFWVKKRWQKHFVSSIHSFIHNLSKYIKTHQATATLALVLHLVCHAAVVFQFPDWCASVLLPLQTSSIPSFWCSFGYYFLVLNLLCFVLIVL